MNLIQNNKTLPLSLIEGLIFGIFTFAILKVLLPLLEKKSIEWNGNLLISLLIWLTGGLAFGFVRYLMRSRR